MNKRKSIKNKWFRLLYLPLAILQWALYTLTFSIIFGWFLVLLGVLSCVGNLIMLDIDEAKYSITMGLMPIILPLQWWYDYITKGEIGAYE